MLLKIIIELIQKIKRKGFDLERFKREKSKAYKIPLLSNIELLKSYQKALKEKIISRNELLEKILLKRPIRSLSGFINVSVLTKNYPCPGNCIYCPIETNLPKSYVSGEPAVERAKKLNFDPYLQTLKRIEMLKNEGHPTDKIDLRIVGGTWSYYPHRYQTWFIKRCFQACNEADKNKSRAKNQTLAAVQKINETAKHRITGISIETRPDFINEKEIKRLRMLGVTRVELGVQSIYDEVLKINQRGHSVKEIIFATKLLKDSGFKICYQIMPNLLGSNLKKDEKMMNELFENPDFRPDYLKIYPCALIKSALLYKFWKTKKYKPYSLSELKELLIKIKTKIPYYVRIQRIMRDIPPGQIITGGAKILNLRANVLTEMKMKKMQCKCIRCREIKENYNPKEKLFLFRENYTASQGKEIFLSFENKSRTKLLSLLRLRITSLPSSSPLSSPAIIREIQTFGPALKIKESKAFFSISPLNRASIIKESKIAPQHQGLGKKLIQEAEKIAKNEFSATKIVIIAGVGARQYFKKLGYRLKNTYMYKKLK